MRPLITPDLRIPISHVGPVDASPFKLNGEDLIGIGAFLNIGQIKSADTGRDIEDEIQRFYPALSHRLHIHLRPLGVGKPGNLADKFPVILSVISIGANRAI